MTERFGQGVLPVIQRTKEGDLINVDGQAFARDKGGAFEKVETKDFDWLLAGRKLETWDENFSGTKS